MSRPKSVEHKELWTCWVHGEQQFRFSVSSSPLLSPRYRTPRTLTAGARARWFSAWRCFDNRCRAATPSRAGQSGAGDAGEERDARADDFADVQTYPLWPSDDTATRTLSTPLPLLLLLTTTMTMIHSYLSRCGQLSCISSNAHTHPPVYT